MNANIVWKKLLSHPGGPCPSCENLNTCTIHEVACEQFEYYVETGEVELVLPKEPTKEIFMEIYFEEELKGEF